MSASTILRMSLFALAAASLLPACAPKNEGAPKSYRLESRLPEEGSALGSSNLVVATDKAVTGIAAVPQIKDVAGPTVIVMDRVDNQTSDPSANFQIYLARIRASLNQSGARQNLIFVESRAKAEGVLGREGVPAEQTARTKPRFALTGTFYDLPRGRTNYHLLTFQLMDLTSSIVVWEDSYEVKL
jgi:hypothetical protein